MPDATKPASDAVRALSIRLTLEDSNTVRALAAETDSLVGDVLAILQVGCESAIRNGGLREKHIATKIQALQALRSPGAGATPPAAFDEEAFRRELAEDVEGEGEAESMTPVVTRRTY